MEAVRITTAKKCVRGGGGINKINEKINNENISFLFWPQKTTTTTIPASASLGRHNRTKRGEASSQTAVRRDTRARTHTREGARTRFVPSRAERAVSAVAAG